MAGWPRGRRAPVELRALRSSASTPADRIPVAGGAGSDGAGGAGGWRPAAAVVALLSCGAAATLCSTAVRRRRDMALAQGVAASTEASEEAQALRTRLTTALDLLKTSLRSRGYLYEQPWYTIIGPPGAGKTTALLNAGLRFPLAEQMGQGAVAGVGGTRLCDWWFTEDAVLIDTAGRYTTKIPTPRGGVDRGVEVLRGVPPGRVDQDGVLGEPPVAQPRASHAGDGALAHLLRQRKTQTGVQQRRRLAGARRPDDGVPRLLIQIAATAQGGLQQVQRCCQPRPQRLCLFGRLGACRDSLCQCDVAAAPDGVEQSVAAAPHQQQCDDDCEPGRPSSKSGSSGAKNHTSPASRAIPTKLTHQRELIGWGFAPTPSKRL